MSKNSFRIDDILSSSEQQSISNSSNRIHPQSIGDFQNNDLQKTLYMLLSQQLNQQNLLQQHQEHRHNSYYNENVNLLMSSLKQNQNISTHESYLNDYYTRLLNLSRFNSSVSPVSNSSENDMYQNRSAKRFKASSSSSSPPLVPRMKQFTNQEQFHKYLQAANGSNSKKPSSNNNEDSIFNKNNIDKSLSYSSASSTASSSTSSLSNSNIDILNSSPRSLLSNSDNDTLGSNSTLENVSPLDALLHLANTTFTNSHQRSIEEVSLLNNLQNFRKMNDENNGILGNELLHDSTRTSHNNSFDSSLNPTANSNSNPISQLQKIQKISSPNSQNHNSHSHQNHNNTQTQSQASVAAAVAAAKRKRKNRTAFTANQIFELEKRFSNQRYLSPHDRDRIAYDLSLSTSQVITWFQNRRAKQKRDIEEMKSDVIAAKTLKSPGDMERDNDISNHSKTIRSDAETSSSMFNKNKDNMYYNASDNEFLNSDEEENEKESEDEMEDINVSTSSSIDLNK